MRKILFIILPVLLIFADEGWFLNILYETVSGVHDTSPYLVINCIICWMLLIYLMYFKKIKLKVLTFKWVVFGLIFNIVFSYIFGSVLHYQQSINRLFYPIFWNGEFMIYVILMISMKMRDQRKIFQGLIIYGIIVSIYLISVKYIPSLIDMMRFTAVSERFGTLRIHRFGGHVVILSLYYFLSYFYLKCKRTINRTYLNILGVFITGYALIFVMQTRITTISIFITILVLGLVDLGTMQNKKFGKKVSIVLVIFMIFVINIRETEFYKSINPEDSNMENQTVKIRIEALKYYYSEFKKTNYVGIGYISNKSNSKQNSITEAINQEKMYLVDLNLVGTLFSYGIICLIVLIYYYKKILYISNNIMLKSNETVSRITFSIKVLFITGIVTLDSQFYIANHALFNGILLFILDKEYQENNFINGEPHSTSKCTTLLKGFKRG